jgi:predicted NBD/HSP70 family sugar kinase
VNPDAVIISGGFLDAGEHLFDGFVGSLRDHALPEAGATLNIERSALGGTAPIRGATLLALQASQQSVRSVWGPSRPSLPASDQLVEPAHVLSSR